MEEKNNEGFSDRFFHNTERPMPRGCTSDDNKGSSFSNSGIFTSSRPNSPASKPLHEASPGFKNRPVPRGMLSSSSSTFGLSNTTDCTVSNLSRQELTPERIKGRYDEKKEEDIGGKHDLQDGSTNHTSAARIHQETSFYSPFRVNTRHLSSFEDRPGSISTSLFSVTNLPVNTSHRLLSQSIKSSRDTREKYYLNNTIQNALSPRRLANKSSVASDTPVATTREKHLERSHEKEEALPTSSINSNDSSMIVTEANDEDNGFIPTTSRTTLDEDHIAQVQESDLTKEEKKEVGTKHQELRPEATLPPVPASLLSPDSSTALSEKQRLTVDLQAKEQDPNQSSLTSPIPLTISRGTTSGITAVIRDISNFDAHKRETWYNFRTKVRKCFCELDDMIEKHRDLFKSDPATGLPVYDTFLVKEAEDLAKKSFQTLEVLRQRFEMITQEFAIGSSSSSNDPNAFISRTRTQPREPLVGITEKDKEEEETTLSARSFPEQISSSGSQLDQSLARTFNTTFDLEEDTAIPITPDRLRKSHFTQETPPFTTKSSSSSITMPIFSPMIPSSSWNTNHRSRSSSSSVRSNYSSSHGAFDEFDRRMEEIRVSLNVIAKGDKTNIRERREKTKMNLFSLLAKRKEEEEANEENRLNASTSSSSSSSSSTSFGKTKKASSFPRNRYDEELETSISIGRSRGEVEEEEEEMSMNSSESGALPDTCRNVHQSEHLGPSNEKKFRELLEKLKGITEEGMCDDTIDNLL